MSGEVNNDPGQDQIYEQYQSYAQEKGLDLPEDARDKFEEALGAALAGMPATDDPNYNRSLFQQLSNKLFGDSDFSSFVSDEFISQIAGRDGNAGDITAADLYALADDSGYIDPEIVALFNGAATTDPATPSTDPSATTTDPSATTTDPSASTTDPSATTTDPSATTTPTGPISGSINLDNMVIAAAQSLNSGNYEAAFNALESAFQKEFGVAPKNADGEYTPEFQALLQQTFEQNTAALTNYYKYGRGKSEGVDTSDPDFAKKLAAEKTPEELMKILTSMAYDGLSTDDILNITYTPPTTTTGETSTAEPSVSAAPTPSETPTETALSLPKGLSDEEVQAKIEKFDEIMQNGGDGLEEYIADLTPEQLTQVMSAYNAQYPDLPNSSFMNQIDNLLGPGTAKDNIMSEIAGKLNDAALAGIQAGDRNNPAVQLICQELHNGTGSVAGTADEFVISMIMGSNPEVLSAVIDNYPGATGTDLISDIKSDFSGDIQKALISQVENAESKIEGPKDGKTYAEKPSLADIKSMAHWDFDKLVTTLQNLSPEDVTEILQDYQDAYGTSLIDYMDFQWGLVGQEYDDAMSMIAGKLNEAALSSDPEVSQAAINTICNELYNSMEGFGTADEFVISMLTQASPDVLNKVAEQYQSDSRSGNDLIHDLQSDFSGDIEQALVSVVQNAGKNTKAAQASTETPTTEPSTTPTTPSESSAEAQMADYASTIAAFAQQNIAQYDKNKDGKLSFDEYYAMYSDGVDIPKDQEETYKGMMRYVFDNMQFDNDADTISAQEFAAQLFTGDLDLSSLSEIDFNSSTAEVMSKMYSCLDGLIDQSSSLDPTSPFYQNILALQKWFYTNFYGNNTQ